MASAVLASRNEPCWGETKVYMRKGPNSNPNPNPKPAPNPNPRASPNAGDHAPDRPGQFHTPEYDEPPAVNAAVSDDSSLFDRKSVVPRDDGGYISFNISTYSRSERRELKIRLESEREQIHRMISQIEAREIQCSARSIGYSTSGIYGGGLEVTSGGLHPSRVNPCDSLVAGPRTNHYYQPPELRYGGSTVVSPRGQKRQKVAPESGKILAGMLSKCRQILTKLMKQKGSSWFNSAVDPVRMGLHDYLQVIKHPMDLGTVKSKMTAGLYSTPLEFAADIRLTFNNALLYNPVGHDVHKIAGQLLRLFEGEFSPAYEKCERNLAAIARDEEEMRRSFARSRLPMPDNAVRAQPAPVISPPPPPPAPSPAGEVVPPVQSQQQQQHIVGKPVIMGKLPKPKARDMNKRLMGMEEKEKLGEGLQSLPNDKMAQVLEIVRRRNVDPVQHDNEIELDFEALDTETLWDLDRFLSNYKKAASKMRRRQEAMAPAPSATAPAEVGGKSPSAKRMKRADPGDEDVDIGEEMPSATYPSVEIEKDAGSSSSSDSDSSSSSDSDSDSSSGSDSGNDDAASPVPGLRPSPRN